MQKRVKDTRHDVSVLDRSFTAVRNLTAFAAAGLLALGALGAMPASAATGASGETDGGSVQILGSGSPAESLQTIRAVSDSAAAQDDRCEDLTTQGTPRPNGQDQGSIAVSNCRKVSPGDAITVTGQGMAQRPEGTGQLTFKIDDVNDDDHTRLAAEQPNGKIDQGGVTVTDARYLPNANGDMSVELRLSPSLSDGVHWVRVLGGSGDGGEGVSQYAKFLVGPKPDTSSPSVAPEPGSTITSGYSATFELSGFTKSAGQTAALVLQEDRPNGQSWPLTAADVAKTVLSSDGAATVAVTIPKGLASGSYLLTAKTDAEESTSAVFDLEKAQAPVIAGRMKSVPTPLNDTQPFSVILNADASPIPTVTWERSTDSGSTWTVVRAPSQGRGELSFKPDLTMTAEQDGDLYRMTATNGEGSATNTATRTLMADSNSSGGLGGVRSEGWNCQTVKVEGDPGARFCIVNSANRMGTLHLEGTGWTTSNGKLGSCIAVKFGTNPDANGDVLAANPASTDAQNICHGGGTTSNIFGYYAADNNGNWIADVPIPTRANATTLAQSGSEWEPGTEHSVTLLTGSARTGDKPRSLRLKFGIETHTDVASSGADAGSSDNIVVVPSGSTGNSNLTLKASGNSLVSIGEAAAGQRPLITPAAPVLAEDDLTDLNRGDVEVEQDGTVLTTTFNSLEPGDWVYLHAWPGPQGVDWLQLDAEKKVRFDIVDLEPGDHKFSFVGQQGELVGWVDGNLPGESSRKSFENTKPVAGLVTPTNWNGPLLIAAFGTLALGLAATTILGIARSRRSA
ncbi:hypothetical protein F8O07_10320 [Pseudoclavibacter sp. CFCC 13796]|uniref:hypothetical protein n=1 Tax=Pseudoclavibacter sp. CFCC 13796 TaxID=2615179 RepID=UPI00130187B1|nr:hypothetical protein [Pseudoclavibacter sp. CFCC 13796]KAB1659959.1 hypothetical protein F8O07_10320 [Pseudoclavibacter sp. CFCC 13796]